MSRPSPPHTHSGPAHPDSPSPLQPQTCIPLTAVVYTICGVPISFWTWYLSIYRAGQADSTVRFIWFFLWFLVHMGFCIWATIGELGWMWKAEGIIIIQEGREGART